MDQEIGALGFVPNRPQRIANDLDQSFKRIPCFQFAKRGVVKTIPQGKDFIGLGGVGVVEVSDELGLSSDALIVLGKLPFEFLDALLRRRECIEGLLRFNEGFKYCVVG